MHSLFTFLADLFLRAVHPKLRRTMSCVTIPDMVQSSYGLVARPVDLADDGSISIGGLDRAFVAK